MPLFKKSDRIAIVCIALLILAGWSIKLAHYLSEKPDDLRVIKNAVKLPAALDSSDSLTVPVNRVNAAIDINRADEDALQTLPMIGPVKAAAIIEYREKHGKFTRLSDIMAVHGIGPATYREIYNHITIEPDSLFIDR